MRRFADVLVVFVRFVAYTLFAAATIRRECLAEESPNPVDNVESVDSLVEGLSSNQFRHRQRAYQALLDRGVEVLPHVFRAIKASDGESSERAFQILSRLVESSNVETRKLAQAELKKRVA